MYLHILYLLLQYLFSGLYTFCCALSDCRLTRRYYMYVLLLTSFDWSCCLIDSLNMREQMAQFFFLSDERLNILKKEKREKLPNGKSDQETRRDSNRWPFAYRVNALPTEPQVTVRGEWSSNPALSIDISPSLTSHLLPHTPCTVWLFSRLSRGHTTVVHLTPR